MRPLQRSLLTGLILPALLAFSPPPAHASDLKCAAPPYGDVAWNYTRLKEREFAKESTTELAAKILRATHGGTQVL